MNFSSWSIRNPIAVILLFLALTIAGLVSFGKMRIQNMPDMDYPVVTVSASLDGATPDQLENDVARKIENALVDLQGIRHMSSTLGDGTVSLMVQFEVDKPIQEALDQVRSKVQGVRADLPSALPEPVVDKVELASQPVLAYAIQSDRMDIQELSWFVDNDLNRMLLGLKGVGKVTRVGGYLVGELLMRTDSELSLPAMAFNLPSSWDGLGLQWTGLGFSVVSNLTLLSGDTHYLEAYYMPGSDTLRPLANAFTPAVKSGQVPARLPAVWPDTGQDAVVLDLPGGKKMHQDALRLRLTGIPVVEG